MDKEASKPVETHKHKTKIVYNKMLILNIFTVIILIAVTFIKNVPWQDIFHTAEPVSDSIPQLGPSAGAVQHMTLPFITLAAGLIKFFGLLVMGTQVTKTAIDILYIAFPVIRGAFIGEKGKEQVQFVSDLAKETVGKEQSINYYLFRNIPTYVLILIIFALSLTDVSSIVGLLTSGLG